MTASASESPKLRILLGSMPRLLRDIVERVLQHEPDMHVVGNGDGSEFSTEQLRQADIIVVSEAHVLAEASVGAAGLGSGTLRVMLVARDTPDVSVHEVWDGSIGDLSLERLISTIRSARELSMT